MATNIERFKTDLDQLIARGEALEYSMIKEISGKDFIEQVKKQHGEVAADAFFKALPDFKPSYEAWYSEALALLRQILPDRAADFIGLYQKPKGRKSIEYGNYVMQDYMQDLTVKWGLQEKVTPSAALPQYRQQLAILKAAQSRFNTSLFDIRQLVQADLFDSELDAARELLKGKFLRAAGAIVGVVLEKHLRQVCDDRMIKIPKKNPGISDLNELLKANGAIEVSQWRHISMLGDIRNLCAHNKDKEPTSDQVSDLIDGVDKVIKTIA